MQLQNWMKALREHYSTMRNKYPEDKLLIVFDIDGTIIDMRGIILYLLQSYDKEFGRQYFSHLTIDDISFHESEYNKLKLLLFDCSVPDAEVYDILTYYRTKFWNSKTMLESHIPFPGVIDIIDWLEHQPNTFVGLNTGRSEVLRKDTLLSLNQVVNESNIEFQSQLLYMNLNILDETVPESKVRGLKYFEQMDFKVICMIDNEPDNLATIKKEFCHNDDVLLLHADTLFISKFEDKSEFIIKGKEYNLAEFLL